MLILLVGLSLFAFYVAVQRGQIRSYDGSIMAHLAHRIVFDHTLTIDPVADTLGLQHPYTSYGFGMTLLEIPFVLLQDWISPTGWSILTLANPLVLAGCGVLLVAIGLRLRCNPSVCVFVALAFGLLTPAVWLSTEGLSEPGVTFGLLLAILGLLRWRDGATGGPVFVGLGLATSILFRPDSVLLVAPMLAAVPFMVPRNRVRSLRVALGVGGPLAVVVVFQLWYNNHRFGSPFATGFAQQSRGQGFGTPLLEGVDLLLRSPGRGFFWTAPVLILGIPGFYVLFRRERILAVTLGLLLVVRLLFFAKWWIPGGGVGWGPRFLLPSAAILAVACAVFLDEVTREASRRVRMLVWAVTAMLATAGALVAGLSVAVPYESYWRRWVDAASPALREVRAHQYYWSIRHSPIAGNVHILREADQPLGLMHFAGGPDVVGIVSLVIGVAAAAAAFVIARRIWRTDHEVLTNAPPSAAAQTLMSSR
jgi:hypothetical protein